jgi:hypothetical protein
MIIQSSVFLTYTLIYMKLGMCCVYPIKCIKSRRLLCLSESYLIRILSEHNLTDAHPTSEVIYGTRVSDTLLTLIIDRSIWDILNLNLVNNSILIIDLHILTQEWNTQFPFPNNLMNTHCLSIQAFFAVYSV